MKPGTGIGAFFDLDGTLVPPPSLEWRFIAYLFAQGDIAWANALRWLWGCAKGFLHDPGKGIESNKIYLSDLRESLASEWAASPAGQSIQPLQDGLEHIAWHTGEGRQVVLVSGTLAPLARAIARKLPGRIEVMATDLEVSRGRWTGQLIGDHINGPSKARVILEFAEQHALQLDQSFAYGDRISDLPMLESVGHPIAVNPDPRLERSARLRGWPICHWRTLSAPLSVHTQCLSAKDAA
jgi:HAD superfamily hydrolase (TIGR01490 family)